MKVTDDDDDANGLQPDVIETRIWICFLPQKCVENVVL